MTISTKFGKPTTAEETFFGLSLDIMCADIRRGITPAVHASLTQMQEMVESGRFSSVDRVTGYSARLQESAGSASPVTRNGLKPTTVF